ncbi:MAG TPA: GNAT family N-acetyltransferase [Puia sp.]|nr:GNAT family N-acetyltransferase [Puia sp.]
MEPATIRVSIAGTADAATIADLSRRTFVDTFGPHNSAGNMEQFLRLQFSRDTLIRQVGAPGNTFLLARLEERIAGYARLYESPALPGDLAGTSAIEVSRIYAEQFALGKGVGKSLMEACIHLARESGKEWIWLGVWEHNHRAMAFYEKMGFEIFGRHIFLLGQDVQHDWLMKRKL